MHHRNSWHSGGNILHLLYVARRLRLHLILRNKHFILQVPEEYLELYEDIGDETRQTHLAMVTHMDDGVKRVMAALEETGMADNSLVIFMSDVRSYKVINIFTLYCNFKTRI